MNFHLAFSLSVLTNELLVLGILCEDRLQTFLEIMLELLFVKMWSSEVVSRKCNMNRISA